MKQLSECYLNSVRVISLLIIDASLVKYYYSVHPRIMKYNRIMEVHIKLRRMEACHDRENFDRAKT